ncbi:MAG TPA: bifunctional 4-hydroxy-2-oxoglutarate aldolase/2-dehydro-3-deoxy-phosphogluconate aldolase [Propionicimonas sp.]|jgi:2-dehydro-3-deoxyphosphogluconate aldolase/(4S)-4-hydroxy-2-oxoglutarate aldolase
MQIIEHLAAHRVIPVVVLQEAAHAAPLAAALVQGGLPVAEITFRTAAAEEAIRIMAARGDVLVGAGTVITVDQVDRAVAAGATFIVSPGTSLPVVRRCQQLGVTVIPGAVTATEVMTLLDEGITTIKFFPAGTSGGPKAIAALSAPFGGVSFIPTGGIGPDNLRTYLDLPAVLAAGGSWMVPNNLVAAGDTAAIAQLCEEATRLAHAG